MFSARLAVVPRSVFRCFATTAKTPAAASKKSAKFQSGYSLFTQDNYSKIQQSEGHLNFGQTSKAIASRWSALRSFSSQTDAQRATYNGKAKENNDTNQVTKGSPGRPRKNESESGTENDASGTQKKTKKTRKSKKTAKTTTTTDADGRTTEHSEDAPRKRSAYQSFISESYATLREEALASDKAVPSLTDAVKQLSPVWKKLSDEEKSAFGELPKQRTAATGEKKRGRKKGSGNKTESKQTEGKHTEGKDTEGKHTEGKKTESKKADHADTKHADTKHADTKHADTKHADTKHADTKHADTKHDTKHADTKHDTKHAEGKNTESKNAEHSRVTVIVE